MKLKGYQDIDGERYHLIEEGDLLYLLNIARDILKKDAASTEVADAGLTKHFEGILKRLDDTLDQIESEEY